MLYFIGMPLLAFSAECGIINANEIMASSLIGSKRNPSELWTEPVKQDNRQNPPWCRIISTSGGIHYEQTKIHQYAGSTTDHRKDVRIREEPQGNRSGTWLGGRPSGSQSAEAATQKKPPRVRRSFVAGSLQRRCRNISMRISGSRWKWNYCRIFCSPQKGSEAKGKVRRHSPSPGRIPNICYVQILRGIQKWLLLLYKASGRDGSRCCCGKGNRGMSAQDR